MGVIFYFLSPGINFGVVTNLLRDRFSDLKVTPGGLKAEQRNNLKGVPSLSLSLAGYAKFLVQKSFFSSPPLRFRLLNQMALDWGFSLFRENMENFEYPVDRKVFFFFPRALCICQWHKTSKIMEWVLHFSNFK